MKKHLLLAGLAFLMTSAHAELITDYNAITTNFDWRWHGTYGSSLGTLTIRLNA